MRPQSIVAVVLALVFGGSAAVGVRQYVGKAPAPRPDMVPVVVAKMNIPRGMLVTPDLVHTREYPKDLVPTGAILKVEDTMDRSAFASMAKDEPMLETKLSPKGQRGLASLIVDGMRAFTITTNLASGVAGFILPGNKVDVLLTMSNGTNDAITGGGSTSTLLQGVEILAVDQTVEAPAENKVEANNLRSVTLLVTPAQAAKLSLGQSKGVLHLSLRNEKDTTPSSTRPTMLRDILLGEAPTRPWDERAQDLIKAWGEALAKRAAATPPPPKPERPKWTIRTIRGSSEGLVVVTPAETPG